MFKMRKSSRRLQWFLAFSVNDQHLSVNDRKKQAGLGCNQFKLFNTGNSSDTISLKKQKPAGLTLLAILPISICCCIGFG
jgi:hypothetical protein